LGMVGNFYADGRKDQLTVCRALPQLFAAVPAAHFVFVGAPGTDAPEAFDECVRVCREQGIAERVRFIGQRADIPDILRALDLFVFSSRADSFGVAVVEALMAGVPAVVSDIKALREVTDDGRYAALFRTGDANDLARQLIELARAPAQRKELSARGREWAMQQFGIATHIARLRHEPFDVLHLNSSFDSRALLRDVATLRMLRSTPTKVFIKFHGSDADLLRTNDPVLRRFTRTLLARTDGIGVLSSEEKENFMRAGVNERRVFVVKNVVTPIDEAAHEAPTTSLRERLHVSADTPLLLFIARFIPAKGLLDVIRACAILRARRESVKLLCVGDGPARRVAEAEVARLQLDT